MMLANNSEMDILPSNTNIDTTVNNDTIKYNYLKHKWVLWAHLPHDNNWKLDSYKRLATFTSIQDTMSITELLPDQLIKNCMLFIMKEGIYPTWEDPSNRSGGCFSYKVTNKFVINVWRDLSYLLVGNTLSNDVKFMNNVCGITISPKKNFCIIKIWTNKCSYQSPSVITDIKNLSPHGCLFKKHVPEY